MKIIIWSAVFFIAMLGLKAISYAFDEDSDGWEFEAKGAFIISVIMAIAYYL